MHSAPGPFTPDSLSWGSRPSRARNAFYPVNKVLPGRTFDFRILSHADYTIPVHYDGARNLPCTGDDGGCWFPHTKERVRHQTWLQVWNRSGKKVELVALTEQAWGTIEDLARTVQDLRGARLQLWRQGNDTRCRMMASLDLSPDLCDKQLPPACDLKKQLCLMWNSAMRDPKRQAAWQARYAADVLPDDDQGDGSPFADDEAPH